MGIRENGFLPILEYTIRKVEMAKSDALKQEIAELNKKFEAMEARVVSLEASLEAKKPKKPKAEKAEAKAEAKAEKPKADKPKPNCPKFTAKIKEEFSKVIGDDYPEDEKEQETLKKEFQKYANAIPTEEYNTVEFATHVRNFMARTPSVASMGGGAGSGPKVMTHSDLVDVQSEVVKTDVVGVYLLDGAQVTGPLRDEEEEDLVTKTFGGKEYYVDEASGRVYANDTEEFLGFARIKSKKFDGLIGHK